MLISHFCSSSFSSLSLVFPPPRCLFCAQLRLGIFYPSSTLNADAGAMNRINSAGPLFWMRRWNMKNSDSFGYSLARINDGEVLMVEHNWGNKIWPAHRKDYVLRFGPKKWRRIRRKWRRVRL